MGKCKNSYCGTLTNYELKHGVCDACEKVAVETFLVGTLNSKSKIKKCIVKGCVNTSSEGRFVGNICSPCYHFIKDGEGCCSQAYRNALSEVFKIAV